MRTIFLAVSLVLSASAFAQEHQHQHDLDAHLAALREHLAANTTVTSTLPKWAVVPAAARTFDIVARSFNFTVTPSPFVVNQGDVVTLRVSVPANDPGTHGILMLTYVETPLSVSPGQTRSVTFTANSSGTFQFICSNSGCGTGHFDMFGEMFVNAVTIAAPTVTSIAPASGSTAGGTNVTLTGTGFAAGATVTIGGVSATNVQVTSSTTITATTPAHAAGAVSIVVTNPDGQSGTLANGFTYALPGPTIASISPITGSTSGNTFVTISGTNFQTGATVTIGGIAATNVNVVNATTITAMTPLGPINDQLGGKDVVVTNPDTNKATLAGAFNYLRPVLALTLVTPSAALPAGGTKIAISGAGFSTTAPTTVTIGGVAATNVQVVDAVTLTATAPPHAAGPVDVVVTSGGTSVTIKGALAYLTKMPKHRAAKH
jgi:IPT/TIG domain